MPPTMIGEKYWKAKNYNPRVIHPLRKLITNTEYTRFSGASHPKMPSLMSILNSNEQSKIIGPSVKNSTLVQNTSRMR